MAFDTSLQAESAGARAVDCCLPEKENRVFQRSRQHKPVRDRVKKSHSDCGKLAEDLVMEPQYCRLGIPGTRLSARDSQNALAGNDHFTLGFSSVIYGVVENRPNS
jgi:hypothetical protein